MLRKQFLPEEINMNVLCCHAGSQQHNTCLLLQQNEHLRVITQKSLHKYDYISKIIFIRDASANKVSVKVCKISKFNIKRQQGQR